MTPIQKTPFALALLALLASACLGSGVASRTRTPPEPAPSRPVNPNQESNDQLFHRFSREIAGREAEPAGEVFENVQVEWLREVPAGKFLRIMNLGYSRALGVACTHCHVEDDFASDDKRPKRAAREMAGMHRMINQRLAVMENLETSPGERFINCSTCHRGELVPE